jgi:hypothetical protein
MNISLAAVVVVVIAVILVVTQSVVVSSTISIEVRTIQIPFLMLINQSVDSNQLMSHQITLCDPLINNKNVNINQSVPNQKRFSSNFTS